MTLEQLRIFVAVAERLHFTRAAAALGLTQSAVSAAIAALETRTRFQLFHRVGRHVELTREGRVFLAEAHHVLASVRQAEEALDELSGLARGHLVLMGSQTVATYWLPPRLHRFRTLYPGIKVSLGVGNTAQVVEAVVDGTIEVGVIEGEASHPDLVPQVVAEDGMVAVVGPEYRDKAQGAIALAAFPWVLREKGSGTREVTLALLAAHGLAESAVRIAFELPSNEAVRVAVEAGAGASVLSTLVAKGALAAGSLIALPCPVPGRRFLMVRHRERRLSRAARAFAETLIAAQ